MRKLRGGFGKKGYMRRMGISKVSTTLKRRLEMIDIGNNLGRDRRCKCGEKEDTEHIIKCEKNRGIGRIKEEWLKETEKGFEIREINRWMERYIEEREKNEAHG